MVSHLLHEFYPDGNPMFVSRSMLCAAQLPSLARGSTGSVALTPTAPFEADRERVSGL
jgi:hypothetical protein